jgi:preprotein translocase subunit SecA
MNAQREVVYKRRYNTHCLEALTVDVANMIYDTAEVVLKAANSLTGLRILSLD